MIKVITAPKIRNGNKQFFQMVILDLSVFPVLPGYPDFIIYCFYRVPLSWLDDR
jgi:hypothetical protein